MQCVRVVFTQATHIAYVDLNPQNAMLTQFGPGKYIMNHIDLNLGFCIGSPDDFKRIVAVTIDNRRKGHTTCF